MRARSGAALSVAILAATGCGAEPPPAARPVVTVFAAASTIEVLGEAARRYEALRGARVVCSFDSSSSLARQIRAGAPADVFVSADEAWMDDLEAAGLIDPATRFDLLTNELVLVAPADRPFEVRISREFDLAAAHPGVARIAVADPAHVPAGRYAKQALEWLGWWPALERRLVPALDVRAALRLVERGEADAGIVYSTDAAASDRVVTLAAFPPESHAPIVYPAALVARAGPGGAAPGFIDFLRSPDMVEVFRRAGFGVPAAAGSD